MPPESAKAFLDVVEDMALTDVQIVAKEGRAMADHLFFVEGDLPREGHGVYSVGIHPDLVNLEDSRFAILLLGTFGLMGATRFGMAMHSYISKRHDMRPSEDPDRQNGSILIAYVDGRWYQKTFVVPREGEPTMEVIADWSWLKLQPQYVGRPYNFMVMAQQVVQKSASLSNPREAREGLAHLRQAFHAGLYGPLKARTPPPMVN